MDFLTKFTDSLFIAYIKSPFILIKFEPFRESLIQHLTFLIAFGLDLIQSIRLA